jgi:hypothetical protein
MFFGNYKLLFLFFCPSVCGWENVGETFAWRKKNYRRQRWVMVVTVMRGVCVCDRSFVPANKPSSIRK